MWERGHLLFMIRSDGPVDTLDCYEEQNVHISQKKRFCITLRLKPAIIIVHTVFQAVKHCKECSLFHG